MKSLFLFGFAFLLVFRVIAQCPSPGTYNSTTNLAFGDDSPTETCNVAGSITVPSNRSPDVILTNSGRFSVGSGDVGNGKTLSQAGDLILNGNSKVTLNTTDTMFVWGNFTMNGTGDLNLNAGTLFVYGNMTITDNAAFGAGGNVIILGDFTVSGSNADVTVGGGFSVGGTANLGTEDITVENGAVFKADDVISGGTLTIDEGGTVYVANDIDDGITVDNNNTSGNDNDCTDNCCGSLCDQTGGDVLTGEAENVLPIKLLFFIAGQESNAVVLNWQTVSEDNFSHFEIFTLENDAKELIAKVPSTNYPSGDQYSFIDDQPSLGLNVYQIKSD
jgi:hypothetical protein